MNLFYFQELKSKYVRVDEAFSQNFLKQKCLTN